MMRRLVGVFGIVLMTIGLPFVVMSAHDAIFGSEKTPRGTLLGLVVLFGALTVWGLKLASDSFGWKIALPRPRLKTERDRERSVVALADSVGGRVTLVEVAARCDLSIEEAEEVLNKLAALGAAEMLVAEDGTVVYDFDILSQKEKRSAKELR
jgi:hypothetical protein